MKSVLVVAAEDFEFDGILPRAKDVVKTAWDIRFSRIAVLNGMQLLLAANGPGPKLAGIAADAVKARERVDSVVSIGLCGGLDPQLKLGDIFVATHVNEFEAQAPVTQSAFRGGRLASLDRVVGNVAQKSQLFAMGMAAVEMEAAAVVARSREWHVPFFCVKAISDTASDGFALDLNEMRDTEGRFSKSRIIKRALRDPFRLVPELLRLKRNSRRAAETLGDFFANCSF